MSISRKSSNVTSVADVTPLPSAVKRIGSSYDKHVGTKEIWQKWNSFFFKGYDMPLSVEEQLSKKEIRSSDKQKVPYNINRHILLSIYSLLIILTNRLFFGWPNLSNLLFKDRVYVWKCAIGADGAYIYEDTSKRYFCKDQDVAVQKIFIIGSSAYYAFSFLNGIIVDYLGSRLSMLLGHAFNFIGWILMLISSENFDAFVLGGVFIAASIDLGSFSTLNISGLYPSSENLIVNIISGAGSLSTGTMLLLDLIISGFDLSFKQFMLWYISSTIGFFFILTIFIFPRTRFYRQYEFDNYYKVKEMELEGMNNGDMSLKGKQMKDEKTEDDTSVDHVSYLGKNLESYDADNNTIKKNAMVDLEASINEEKNKKRSISEEKQNINNDTSKISKSSKGIFKNERVKDLIKIFICAHFIAMCIYAPLNGIYNNFYFSALENILSQEKNDIFGYMLPFSVIPCVLLGKATDKYGVMLMFAYELFFAYAMYAFSYSRNNIFQWLSVISGAMYAACANGQVWTFVSFTFSSRYHSTLIGILNLLTGAFSLLRIYLLKWAKDVEHDYTYINLLLLCLIGVNTAIAIYLVYIRRKHGEKVTIGDKTK